MGVQTLEIKKDRAQPKGRGQAWIWISVALILVVAVGVVASGAYGRLQVYRLGRRARLLYEAKDYAGAILFDRRVLQIAPQNIEANRLMADLADAVGSRQSLYWRRTASELNPTFLPDHLAWADTALRISEPAMAEQALANVDAAGRKTAAYDEMEGRVAEASKEQEKAESEFKSAMLLEPQNHHYQLDVARMQLLSGDAAVRVQARSKVERLAAEPDLFSLATHALIEDALSSKNGDKALALSRKLEAAPGSSFEDCVAYLALLQEFQRPEFASYLSDLQERNVGNADRVASLIGWMNSHSLSLLALDWQKRLPSQLRSSIPVAAEIAEAYVIVGDWSSLKVLISGGNWGRLEFMRQALLARVARQDGDESKGQAYWDSAVHSASASPEDIAVLARIAISWGWEDSSEGLLWSVAQGSYDQQWALGVLYQRFYASHSTRNLLRVVTRMYEIDPSDPWTRNNLAAYELLLQSNVQQALNLSRDLYQADPGNVTYATTYAFALHLFGRSVEGVSILKKFGERQLSDPANAIYYGTLLAATGADAEAGKYLDIAGTGTLFPEEAALLSQARDQLAYRVSKTAPLNRR